MNEEVRAELKLILVTRVNLHQVTAPRQLYMSRESSRQRQWDSRQTQAPRDCLTGRCCREGDRKGWKRQEGESNERKTLKAMKPLNVAAVLRLAAEMQMKVAAL